jgi:hypothetical protein
MSYAQTVLWFLDDRSHGDFEIMLDVFDALYVRPMFVACIDSRTHEVTPR